jgi:hypothetical protein
MMKRGLRRRAAAFLSAIAAVLLFVGTAPPAASADTMRTLNVAVSCASGIVPFGLQANHGSGWYFPNGSSYAVGGTKYFTVFIPASASSLALDTHCYLDMREYNGGPAWPEGTWLGYTYSITPGTSTINANASLWKGQVYPGPWVRYCTISNITYS